MARHLWQWIQKWSFFFKKLAKLSQCCQATKTTFCSIWYITLWVCFVCLDHRGRDADHSKAPNRTREPSHFTEQTWRQPTYLSRGGCGELASISNLDIRMARTKQSCTKCSFIFCTSTAFMLLLKIKDQRSNPSGVNRYFQVCFFFKVKHKVIIEILVFIQGYIWIPVKFFFYERIN